MWSNPAFDEHEKLTLVHDRASGLAAIIAIHSTHRGPSAGGTRFWHYANPDDALTDALRLSQGMSYKNAMADLPMGGGKAVILAPKDGQVPLRTRHKPDLANQRRRGIGRSIDCRCHCQSTHPCPRRRSARHRRTGCRQRRCRQVAACRRGT